MALGAFDLLLSSASASVIKGLKSWTKLIHTHLEHPSTFTNTTMIEELESRAVASWVHMILLPYFENNIIVDCYF